jgi:hypothetical protein
MAATPKVSPYQRLKLNNLITSEVEVDGYRLYTAESLGTRLGIINRKGVETSVVLTPEQFKTLIGPRKTEVTRPLSIGPCPTCGAFPRRMSCPIKCDDY